LIVLAFVLVTLPVVGLATWSQYVTGLAAYQSSAERLWVSTETAES
jgi:hypothetical protein